MNINVDKVIYSGNKTIVLWADGSKTVVSCGAGDQYDEYAGFCAAFVKRAYGSTHRVKRMINAKRAAEKKAKKEKAVAVAEKVETKVAA